MPAVLFVHNGIPGRFAFLGRRLRELGWTGVLLNGEDGLDIEGFPTVRWDSSGFGKARPDALVEGAVTALHAGEAAARAALKLRQGGFRPDLIIGHPGWGEMLFLSEVWPDTPQIQLGEFYYQTCGTHFNFDPEFPVRSLQAHIQHQIRNSPIALSYAQATHIVAPTPFQASTFPAAFRSVTRIIHEGVDTKRASRIAGAWIKLAGGTVLDGSRPVITFINRRFEPMRGFHVFMRALPKMLKDVPDAHVLIIGLDDPKTYVTYGSSPFSWKQRLLEEVGDRIDRSRVHFTGALSYPQLVDVLSLSWVHVYLTYPFVLSWSLLDAMACGCTIIGSDTAPVRDVIRHGVNGLLTDFFDVDGLAGKVVEVCRSPGAFAHLAAEARATVVREWDRETVCEPLWLQLIHETVAGGSS